jgi:beta-glucosidase-like glycosyl hydrolase
MNNRLGPMMNLARDAAGGRNWEGGGADPFLSGVHASQNIQGIQSQGVIACAKHLYATFTIIFMKRTESMITDALPM